jgi:hypothetical protein
MPVRLYPRDYVEAKLRKRGCVKLKDYSHGSGGLWMTLQGFHFVVPTEPDGHTDENSLRAIISEIEGE